MRMPKVYCTSSKLYNPEHLSAHPTKWLTMANNGLSDNSNKLERCRGKGCTQMVDHR